MIRGESDTIFFCFLLKICLTFLKTRVILNVLWIFLFHILCGNLI